MPVKFVNFIKSRLIFNIFYCFWMLVNKLKKSVAKRCSVKKVVLEISQSVQENTSARVSFLIKLWKNGERLSYFLHVFLYFCPFCSLTLPFLNVQKNNWCLKFCAFSKENPHFLITCLQLYQCLKLSGIVK